MFVVFVPSILRYVRDGGRIVVLSSYDEAEALAICVKGDVVCL